MLHTFRTRSRTSFIAMAIGIAVLTSACSGGSDDPTTVPSPTDTPVPPTAVPTGGNGTAVATSTSSQDNATPTAGAGSPVATNTAVPAVSPTTVPTATTVPDVSFTPGVVNEVVIPVGKDTSLYQSSIGAISNGTGEGLFAGSTNNGSVRRGLVWFDILSAVPTGGTIETVELSMSVTRSMSGPQNISVHRVTANWGEGTVDASANEGSGGTAQAGDATWVHTFSPDQQWQTAGGDFETAPSTQANVAAAGRYTWDSTDLMTRDVQEWLDNPDSNFGWLLTGGESANQTAKRFASKESSVESARPALVVRFTPPG